MAGPSQSGKSWLVRDLLDNLGQLFSTDFAGIYFSYSEWQDLYEEISAKHGKIHWIQGLPKAEVLKSVPGPKLLIIDDQMLDMKNDKCMVDLAIKGVHHWSISSIYLLQNLFYANTRTARINAQYIFLMRSPGDQLSARNLAKQLYPGNTRFFLEAYGDATRNPHSYLLIDLHQQTPNEARLRTNIMPGQMTIAYVPKNL